MIALILVYGTVAVAMTAYNFGYRVFTEAPMEKEPGTDVTIKIEKSMNGQQIGNLLQKKGLIRDADLFRIQLKLSVYEDKIKPGEYKLNTSMTAKDMMVVMSTAAEKLEETKTTEEDVAEDTQESKGE